MSHPHDIETIISEVRAALPAVHVVQMHRTHPADDDGLWWFRLPEVRPDIQIESSTYDCPFRVEHSDMATSAEAFAVHSVPEAVHALVSYLRSVSGTA